MKRALSAIAATTATVALLAPLVATADHRPGHVKDANPNLTISVDPNPIRWPKQVTISGVLRGSDNANKTVELQEKPHPFRGPFRDVVTTTTDEKGAYRFLNRPDEHTVYRVVADLNPDEVSGEETVRSRMKITRRVSDKTPVDGQEITFFGRVGPAHEGHEVRIQRRRKSGSWKTMTTTRLSEAGPTNHSRYSTQIEMKRDGKWRAKVRGDANHRGNKSHRIKIDVL
jgi:hypothetical protein